MILVLLSCILTWFSIPREPYCIVVGDFIQSEPVQVDDVSYFFVNRDLCFLESAYGSINYDQIIKSFELPRIYKEGGIMLFRALDSNQLHGSLKQRVLK